jgi:hypothetical protein
LLPLSLFGDCILPNLLEFLVVHRVIHYERNQGKGAALRTGIVAATATLLSSEMNDPQFACRRPPRRAT